SFGLLLVLAATSTPPGLSQSAAAPGAQVRLTLTVTDEHGRDVSALSKEHVTVFEEKTPAEVTLFEQSNPPASVVIVFDLSRNQTKLLAAARKAFFNLAARGSAGSEYFILGFDQETHLASDWARTPEQLAAGLDRLAAAKPSNKHALYDALSAALRKAESGAHTKRVVVLLSDGRDHGSRASKDEVLEQLKRSEATLYAVNPRAGESLLPGAAESLTLNKLCSVSGGFASYASTGVEFYEFFERLAVELMNQYTVAFAPRDAARAGWLRLDFKAKTLELRKPPSNKLEKIRLFVRAREGYYR
ncbi:MAG TPA: VWA domain-containing protein, partial [Pyrinomonadaceae bacterium]|nr:VWA domain-containing protein [Pyrinomonadaceae bacterium]